MSEAELDLRTVAAWQRLASVVKAEHGVLITDLMAEVRREAIEEAVKVAEHVRFIHGEPNEKDPYDIAWDMACNEIIELVRALHEGKG